MLIDESGTCPSAGRFAHTKEYVVGQAMAAGFALASYEEIIPRMESNVPVHGHLFSFTRVSATCEGN